MPLLNRMTNQQIDEAKSKEASTPKKMKVFLQNLASSVRKKWNAARDAAREDHGRMLEDKEQRLGIYDGRKVAAMKELFGREFEPVYMMLSETKCRALEAWVKELIISPGKDPFDLQPTPVPDLPQAAFQIAAQKVQQKMSALLQDQLAAMGGQATPEMLQQMMQQFLPAIKDMTEKEVKSQARKAAKEMHEKIADQLREGNWHEALEESLWDLSTYGTAIIKGPVNRLQTKRWRDYDVNTNIFTPVVEDVVVPIFERVNPLDFFPGPNNVTVEDGYVCHRIFFTRKELADLRYSNAGFNKEAIERVLETHMEQNLRSETTQNDSKREHLEGKDEHLEYNDRIECIEYWGYENGKLLKEYGMSDIKDPNGEYAVAVWLVDNEVIKCMINPNPLGQIPFSKCNMVEDPDNFWGRGGIPRLIKHVQTLANIIARSFQLNVSIASGPQVEVNDDRLAAAMGTDVYPFKVWKTTNNGIAEGKAVNFYAPPLVTEKLIAAYQFCSALADEDSGVPKYAHGESNVGGAGKTASGLSMLMSTASRGVKAVVSNIDNGLITGTVQKMYDYNIDFEELDIDLLGDVTVVPKGSTSLIAKEQQAVRRNEFLATTNNPVDVQILGPNGRKELLKMAAEALEIDIDRVFGEEDAIMEAAGLQPQNLPSQAAPRNLNEAGQPVQGKDYQLEEGRE